MKQKRFIIALIVLSMMAMYGSVPNAKAALSLTSAKDTLSTSLNSAVASHTIVFTTQTPLVATDKIVVTFHADFSAPQQANITCPAGTTNTASGQTAICTASGGVATGTKTIVVTGMTNPATTTSYLINITTESATNVVKDSSDIRVAILPQVVMTATVSATLAFTVNGTTTNPTINGIAVTQDSTATSTPFGTLNIGATSTVAQDLTVATNADNGYIVTVEQDQELHNTTGSNINSFNNATDGTGTVVPEAWAAPTSILDSYNTYGHMGLTISDGADNGNADFTGSKFAGLNGTSTMQIMSHNGPSDGVTLQKGFASVVYAVQIGALQEAGDYTNTLTYICTPTF